MFGPKHYVPILRWKRGERFALRELNGDIREFVTPLIEITPKMFAAPQTGKKQGVVPHPGKVLFETSKQVLKSWGYAPFFIDFWHVDRRVPRVNRKHALEYFANEARAMHLQLIPVTALTRSMDYQTAVREVARIDGRGVCVRVSIEDLRREKFGRELQSLLSSLLVEAQNSDLLLDCQVLEVGTTLSMDELLNSIPLCGEWRTVTLASGAFPKDLQQFEPGMQRIARADWLAWNQLIRQHGLKRKPSFSDYTIQFGRYEEPPENCNPSASIRYTLPEAWLVLRGEGIMNKKGPGRKQWPAQAVLLCESSEFYGAQFSAGDDYVFKVRNGREGHGSPETWIRAAINHHLTVVARQIAGLPDF